VLGFDADEIAGRSLIELVHPDDGNTFGRAFDGAREMGTEFAKDQRIRTRAGTYLWMDCTMTVVREAAGNVSGFEIVARDVTTSKLADAARKKATGDLARMVMDLRAALDCEREEVAELGERHRLTNALLTAVPRELLAPLASIRVFADRLADSEVGQLTDRQQCVVDAMRRDSRFVAEVLDDLETIGGIESGTLALERCALELGPS
jgi:PAS domain S-box-containing protein